MSDGFNKAFGPDGTGWNSHIITAKRGLEMVAAAKKLGRPAPEEDYQGLAFMDEAVVALQGNRGHRGIVAIKAHNGHHHTEVWFSVDANKQLIVGDSAIALENGERCPPFC